MGYDLDTGDHGEASGGGKKLLVFGLGCALLGGLLCVVLGFVGSKVLPGIMVSQGSAGLAQAIRASELPASQKTGLLAQIDRVNGAYDSGELGFEGVGQIIAELGQGPLLPVGFVYHLGMRIEASPADVQKADIERAVQRVARGLIEGQIANDVVTKMLERFGGNNQGTNAQRPLTAEEGSECLGLLSQQADEAGVPDEAYEVDFTTQFEKAVDAAVGK
jgi:hypothetical protein